MHGNSKQVTTAKQQSNGAAHLKSYPPNTPNDAKSLEGDRFIQFWFGTCLCNALVFQFGVMAEVDEKPKFKPARFQVIKNLSVLLVSQFGDGLQFDDYFVVADKIREIFLVENSASIFKGQSRLRNCWDAAMLEFNAQTFLIHRLVKAAALVFVNFEAGANNGITFLLEDEVWR
jgi:hypothetical protein